LSVCWAKCGYVFRMPDSYIVRHCCDHAKHPPCLTAHVFAGSSSLQYGGKAWKSEVASQHTKGAGVFPAACNCCVSSQLHYGGAGAAGSRCGGWMCMYQGEGVSAQRQAGGQPSHHGARPFQRHHQQSGLLVARDLATHEECAASFLPAAGFTCNRQHALCPVL
jgi:hypothetical protein